MAYSVKLLPNKHEVPILVPLESMLKKIQARWHTSGTPGLGRQRWLEQLSNLQVQWEMCLKEHGRNDRVRYALLILGFLQADTHPHRTHSHPCRHIGMYSQAQREENPRVAYGYLLGSKDLEKVREKNYALEAHRWVKGSTAACPEEILNTSWI